VALVVGFIATPIASAQQSVNLFIGGFTPRSLDGRGTDDVLFQDGAFLSSLNRANGIDIGKFNGVTVGGDYLFALGPLFEGGLGLSFYQRTVPTVYTAFVNADGSDISQDLKLRIVPLSATVRFVPLGHRSPVQPYVGAGVDVFLWHYSETGQFLDSNNVVFIGNFTGSGATAGPVVLGGVRFGIGSATAGGEIRWQSAKPTLPSDQGFAGPKIDLGGVSYLFTVGFRF
jgi:hypothetical protein